MELAGPTGDLLDAIRASAAQSGFDPFIRPDILRVRCTSLSSVDTW
jgi:hypothetical protein